VGGQLLWVVPFTAEGGMRCYLCNSHCLDKKPHLGSKVTSQRSHKANCDPQELRLLKS
jgi:allophanate hydrolase subunit 2